MKWIETDEACQQLNSKQLSPFGFHYKIITNLPPSANSSSLCLTAYPPVIRPVFMPVLLLDLWSPSSCQQVRVRRRCGVIVSQFEFTCTRQICVKRWGVRITAVFLTLLFLQVLQTSTFPINSPVLFCKPEVMLMFCLTSWREIKTLFLVYPPSPPPGCHPCPWEVVLHQRCLRANKQSGNGKEIKKCSHAEGHGKSGGFQERRN